MRVSYVIITISILLIWWNINYSFYSVARLAIYKYYESYDDSLIELAMDIYYIISTI